MKSTRNQLIYFFLITFGISWGLNFPRVFEAFGLFQLPSAYAPIAGNLALFGPAIAAFVLTPKGERKALLRRGWQRDFKKIWLLPTLFLLPALGLLTVLAMSLFGQPIDWANSQLPPALIVPIGLLIWLLAYPEEYGWRGYAQDRLQNLFTPLTASVVLGLLWGLWHLPLHFIDTTTQFVIPVWEYIAQTVLLTIIYTWLYNATGGSILIVTLLHGAGNLAGAIIPFWTTSAGRWLNFSILLVTVVIIVLMKFPGTEQRNEETETSE